MTTQNNYSLMLLSKDNKEVKRHFEDSYVASVFRQYQLQKVPDSDIVNFFHKAQITGANPILSQIFLIPRKTKININGKEEWVVVGTVVFNYAFLELKAQESGQYGGYEAETGPDDYFDPIKNETRKMLRSRVTVIRDGKKFTFTAWWDEYVQTNSYGVTAQWKGKPNFMLEKCARAGALRAAFPEWLSGVYSQEEMGAIEKDDQVIEAEFQRKEEVKKVEEIQENIAKKKESSENSEEVEGLLLSIKDSMAKITEGADVKTKGKAMSEHLGVNKFDDLKKKSLDELRVLDNKLLDLVSTHKMKPKTVEAEVVKETKAESKTETTTKKPSFVLPQE